MACKPLRRPVGTTDGYMPGFGNDFETEALPGALPQGMNSPQKVNYGLYGEQLQRHGLHRAQPPERADVVLPHPPIGQAHAPLHRRSTCPTGNPRRMWTPT